MPKDAPSRSPSEQEKHVEAEQYAGSPPAVNPLGDTFNIIVSVPESINIRMVDASVLEDYEIWLFIASILSNAVVGFYVAYCQAIDSKAPSASYIGWTVFVFVLLFALSLIVAVMKRCVIRKKSREVKLKTTGASL